MTRFHIAPDIAEATTLDTAFYRDPAVYEAVREQVFARSWQWLGDTEDAAEPGALSPRELLPGLLDEPLLLARDREGALRCLSNVCTHRGNLLVQQRCVADQIRCGYHSRRFDLAGRMTFMPEFAGARNFPSPGDHLPQVPFGTWGTQVFASVDPVVPLEAVIGDMQARLGWMPLAQLRHDPSRDAEYAFDAHWALYVENYLEGLHIPFVHPALNQVLDMGLYEYELRRWCNLQLAEAREGEQAFELPPQSPDHGRRIAAYYYWVFPNLMLNFYPWGLSVNVVQPQGPSRTRVVFRSYVGNAALLGGGAGGALHQVEMEDEAVVLTVQRGIRSRLYRHGRYSPSREQGVHHFHRLLCERLAS